MKIELSMMEEQLPRGRMWGERREREKKKKTGEKQTREQLLLQAGSKRGACCMCFRVGVVQPQALHSTMGTTAHIERGEAAVVVWGKSVTLRERTKRKRKREGRLTGLRRRRLEVKILC